MKTIEIDDDIYKHILNNIEAFGETPSQILRRLLVVSEYKKAVEPLGRVKNKKIAAASKSITAPITSALDYAIKQKVLNKDYLHQGISRLIDDEVFISETIVTNKFMMILATMYFEKTALFIEAAETTKGRTRAYLGMHLEELLNSDNEKEVSKLQASKPRMIPEIPFWVITNANTGRKRIILAQMMASMGYSDHLVERIKQEL